MLSSHFHTWMLKPSEYILGLMNCNTFHASIIGKNTEILVNSVTYRIMNGSQYFLCAVCMSKN